MLTIQCTADIEKYSQKLSPFLLAAISNELSQLCEMLNFDEEDSDFQLDTTGHTIACLEHYEPLSCLSTLGLTFPFFHVEYVEIYELPEVKYYRTQLMYDNESFTTVFSVKGTQNTKLEEWLADQAIHGEGENR